MGFAIALWMIASHLLAIARLYSVTQSCLAVKARRLYMFCRVTLSRLGKYYDFSFPLRKRGTEKDLLCNRLLIFNDYF